MIFGDSVCHARDAVCVAGLTTDYSVLAGDFDRGLDETTQKKNYLHGHDVGDDVLPKCCIRCHQKSTWFGSFSGSPFSLEFVVGVGVLRASGVEV